MGISTADIRNWNAFCEAADQCLAASSRLKQQNKRVHGAFFAFIGIFVVGINVLPRVLNEYGLLKYVSVIVFPIVLVFLALFCRVIRNFYASIEKLEEVCERHTTNGVTYRLGSEHWGGCAKPHVKRYYINVDVADEEEPAPMATAVAVLQEDDAPDAFVSNYVATDATPSSTLADMLK